MIEIIPAIDLIDGKCVRLTQGDYNIKKVYNNNPLEVAKTFERHGIRRLHLVDLDGAREKHVVNLEVLKTIASKTSLIIDFGGGIKTKKDIEAVFNSGAGKVTVGSIAISDPPLFSDWIEYYGKNKIILGADFKNNKIAISGWLNVTEITLFDFLENYKNMGVENVLCTDISKDGMLKGSSIEIYKEISENYPELNLIASGGITDISEIEELNNMEVYGVIIGKAIYEGKIKLEELERFCE